MGRAAATTALAPRSAATVGMGTTTATAAGWARVRAPAAGWARRRTAAAAATGPPRRTIRCTPAVAARSAAESGPLTINARSS